MNQKTNLIWAPAMMSIGAYSKGKKSLRRELRDTRKKMSEFHHSVRENWSGLFRVPH